MPRSPMPEPMSGIRPIRVHVDDQVFGWQPRGGISRYFTELMRAFAADPSLGVQLTTPRLWTKNRHAQDAGLGRPLPTRLGQRRQVLKLANRLRRPTMPPDIVHNTYYDTTYLARSRRAGPLVATVHDMIPEMHPELFPRGNPHRGKRSFVEAADLIICVSHTTRADLLEQYGAVRAPIVVTPLGVDARFAVGAPRPAALPERYVLFVGDRVGYKDFTVLVEGMAAAALPDVRLVAVGGGEWREHEVDLLTRRGLLERSQQVSLSDAELAGAYAGAVCFVFPSRYEGFGLPTLEAMSCGCPVVLADSPSHREVGADAALFFPRGDADALAAQLRVLAEDEALRSGLAARGVLRAAPFTWADTARLTAAAYREHAVPARTVTA